MFELQVLLANVVAPATIVLSGFLLLPRKLRKQALHLMLTALGGIAIWTAFGIRIGFAWWPEDAWQKVPVAALIVTVVALLAELFRSSRKPDFVEQNINDAHRQSGRSATQLMQCGVIAIAAGFAAWLVYPRGEGWVEVQNQQFQWCAVITLAVSLSWWGLAGCKRSLGPMVGLATIPVLIAGAFLTSLSMMKVTEPLVAIATVIGLCSLIDLRTGHRSIPLVIAPSMFAMSGFIEHANFQSYLTLPRTLYFLAMLSPAMLSLVARMAQRKSQKFAIIATFGLALALFLAISVWTYIAGEVGEADWSTLRSLPIDFQLAG